MNTAIIPEMTDAIMEILACNLKSTRLIKIVRCIKVSDSTINNYTKNT